MRWPVETLNSVVDQELAALPVDLRARFGRIAFLIEDIGLERMREPHVRHLEGRLWERRLQGKDRIARALYVTASGRRVIVVRVFVKKTQATPPKRDRSGAEAGKGGAKMTRVRDLHEQWMADPAYREAYEALAPEFELARALIRARTRAGLTQAQLAERMQTSQSVIARLKSGRARPSTTTLERIAQATGTRLRISFERSNAGGRDA
jgi:phage-related protein